MKSKIIGDKINNRIPISKIYYHYNYSIRKSKGRSRDRYRDRDRESSRGRDRDIKENIFLKRKHFEDKNTPLLCNKSLKIKEKNMINKKRKRDIDFKAKKIEEEYAEEEGEDKNFSNSEKIINLEEKEKVMKILRTQDFNKGNWEENNETKKIKEKYIKEYNLLICLKDTKINDSIAMTIIIIYFIYKEYHELLSKLSRIIKKAKNFIRKETNTSYEKIIKQIGIK